jgi:sigma-B regulation protein RsbU (phosphoserine phosphatase)
MKELLKSTEVILDCLSDGVYVCDRQRSIVYWSKSAERITGWQSADVLGRRCLEDILRHEDKNGNPMCGEEHCPLHRAMVTGVTTTVPMIVYAHGKDGRKIPMQVTAAPIRSGAGEVVGGVETFRDVSPLLVDLERATKIQTQTLEQEVPDDPRLRFSAFYLPHDIVGGDYYGVKQLDEDRYGFLLADMEGHGLVAALYTMHLAVVWNQHYQLLENPAEFAAEVNRELVRLFGGVVTFAAAVCGVIDARAGKVRLAGAGGPSPLVIHENQTAEKIRAPGPPFGVIEDVPYQEQTLQLEPGDSILLFSDGAFEIHNAQNELLGVDGLARILKSLDYPQTPLNMGALAEELLKFSNDIRLQDDIAIIEIRFLGQHSSD